MRNIALIVLTLTFSAGAYAAELNGICAADIKANSAAAMPAPSIAKAYAATAGVSVCEAAMAQSLDFRSTIFRDTNNQALQGFEKGYYTQHGPMQVALVLQTSKEAYYYYEDCDICANIDKCDLNTGAITRVAAAHSVDCSDIAPFAAGAVYNACAKPGQTCAAVGDAVRIPKECCSGNAEPAYGGEMVCVEAPKAAYNTSCRIQDGEAIGVIRNLSQQTLRYSGSVSFYFYNSADAMIDENLTMESGTIGANESRTITNLAIPLRAVSCTLDISAAIRK